MNKNAVFTAEHAYDETDAILETLILITDSLGEDLALNTDDDANGPVALMTVRRASTTYMAALSVIINSLRDLRDKFQY